MHFAEHYRRAVIEDQANSRRRTSASGSDRDVARMLERLLDNNRTLARENAWLKSELATANERVVHMRHRIDFLRQVFEPQQDRKLLTDAGRKTDPRVRAYANHQGLRPRRG